MPEPCLFWADEYMKRFARLLHCALKFILPVSPICQKLQDKGCLLSGLLIVLQSIWFYDSAVYHFIVPDTQKNKNRAFRFPIMPGKFVA